MKRTLTGWLLDVYEDARGGLLLWLLGEDGARCALNQDFPVTFYAAGPAPRLRALWRWLEEQGANGSNPKAPIRMWRAEHRDLFEPAPVTVLAVQSAQPCQQPGLFREASRTFADLTWYDADILPALRHAAQYGTFPLARLEVQADETRLTSLRVLDTPWELDPAPPPLRILHIQPDDDPQHAPPAAITLRWAGRSVRLPLAPVRGLLVNLAAILKQYDPDLLLTNWGDTWLIPWLLEQAEKLNLRLPLSRDPCRGVLQRDERSYQAYGQVVHRGRQAHLFGRWHVDVYNAMLYADYGLEGLLESARVTALPVQAAARLSPGSGISAMQVVTALRGGILVPWHKQQSEQPKSALDLLHTDQGGLVYQPLTGVHRDVAELDFISMYPSIMARFNISPEVPIAAMFPDGPPGAESTPPGLIPRTLSPLLEKRIALKRRSATLPRLDPRRKTDRARTAAHKWLLVTCFGYLGYKNARFGRIEAHQAVTAWSRECLLRAKEAAEDAGGEVLHLYVDGLWVKGAGCATTAGVQPLLDEITRRTGLPIALDGIYRWVVFLPSRVDARLPVANRYFGVFQDGTLKVRGIEARRHDTPPWVSRAQMHILEMLAQVENTDDLPALLPQVQAYAQNELRRLRAGRVPLEELVLRQKITRAVEEYRSPSPAARAAAQMQAAGRPPMRPGQYVRFFYSLGRPGVRAYDLPTPPETRTVDVPRYAELLRRAVETVSGWVDAEGHYNPQPCLNVCIIEDVSPRRHGEHREILR